MSWVLERQKQRFAKLIWRENWPLRIFGDPKFIEFEAEIPTQNTRGGCKLRCRATGKWTRLPPILFRQGFAHSFASAYSSDVAKYRSRPGVSHRKSVTTKSIWTHRAWAIRKPIMMELPPHPTDQDASATRINARPHRDYES